MELSEKDKLKLCENTLQKIFDETEKQRFSHNREMAQIRSLAVFVLKVLKDERQRQNLIQKNMIFENLIKTNKEAFIAKVIEVATKLGVKAEHLMFLMWFETAHTLDHTIQNSIGATGLIQFMPATAKGLGTTTSALKIMTNVKQMDYVYKHLAMFSKHYIDFVDLYCGIFWPAAVGKPDSFRITSDMVAKQNPIFDLNKDLDIEKSEIRQALCKQIPKEYMQYFI